MKTSIKLFNFAGAPVELSLWFFLIFLFAPVSWCIAVFLSVLIHELAHAFVADRRGWRVYGIRIDLFTGSASVDTSMPERDSIAVVAAGPLSNLLVAVLCVPIFVLLSANPLVTQFVIELCIVNVFLFALNILPIYPMDGGRIVKDALFLNMKSNRALAKKIAGYISLVFSVALFLFSLYTSAIILAVFSAIFIYTSLIEVDIIKKT